MATLTREDVLKLARLSRLKLSDAEIEEFRVELSEILEYVKLLDSADTSGLEPTYQVTGLKNVTRPDDVEKYSALTKELLKNAPATQDSQFKVQRVL